MVGVNSEEFLTRECFLFLSQTPQEEEIRLVPELSSRTGLTDDMRADFRVMKVYALCHIGWPLWEA